MAKKEWSFELETADDFDSDAGYSSFEAALKRAQDRMATEKWTVGRVMENTEIITLTRKVNVTRVK